MTAPWLLIFSWIYLSTTLTGLPLLAVFHSWARLGLVHKKAQKLYLPSPPCMPSSTYPWRSPQRPRHIIRAARMPPPTRMSAISPSEYSSRDFIGLEGEMKKYHFRPFHSISSLCPLFVTVSISRSFSVHPHFLMSRSSGTHHHRTQCKFFAR